MNTKKLFKSLIFTFFVVIFTSCENEINAEYDETNEILEEQNDKSQIEDNLQGRFTGNRNHRWISFDNWSNGDYTRERANYDFGNSSALDNVELNRLSIVTDGGNKRLSVKLLKNSTGDTGGQYARIPIKESSDSYTLTYKVKFPTGFIWSRGGKIPGLAGGLGYSGGAGQATRDNGDGWSSRIMWGKENDDPNNPNRNKPFLYPYIYYNAMSGNFGNNFGEKIYINRNQWFNIEMYVKMNTGLNENAQSDGVLTIKVNGQTLVNRTNMKWATKSFGKRIKTLMMGVFRGGANNTWWASQDNNILFDSFFIVQGE